MTGELVKAKEILKIGQRVEFYVEADDNRYASRIEDIDEDMLEVAMPMTKAGVPIIPQENEKIYGVAIGKRSRYRFFTNFKSKGYKDGRLPVWQITMPDTVERFQNREFVRIKVNLKASANLIDADGTIQASENVKVVDLSGGGICLAFAHEVTENTKMGLVLTGIPGASTIDVMCRVVRCLPVERGDGTVVYHVGAEFQHLPRATSNKIIRYLFSVQRVNIAKGIKDN